MPDALTPPFLLAAFVLLIAALAKLRTPSPAAHALAAAGILPGSSLPACAALVRAGAAAEAAVGAWCLLAPSVVAAALLGLGYLGFALLAGVLRARQAACGCFGEAGAPVGLLHVALNVVFAAVAAAAAASGVHGLGWLAAHSGPVAVLGVAGAGWAAVLAYTWLPRAWNAWEAA